MTNEERAELEKLGVQFIEAPMMTEDGLLNPVFEAELAAAINAIPKTYERLSEDPEWNTPRLTYYREITGYFANWAVRQIDHPDNTPFPPGLEKMVGYLTACIRPRFSEGHGWGELSLCDINRMLHEILWPEAIFQSWNDKEVLPGWLDLDALLRNVCISIRDERRHFDAFNAKFEDGWAKLEMGDAL